MISSESSHTNLLILSAYNRALETDPSSNVRLIESRSNPVEISLVSTPGEDEIVKVVSILQATMKELKGEADSRLVDLAASGLEKLYFSLSDKDHYNEKSILLEIWQQFEEKLKSFPKDEVRYTLASWIAGTPVPAAESA